MTIITLNWNALEDHHQIFSIPAGTSGVYIWGFYKDNFVPYMVGKATGTQAYSDIRSRLRSHVAHLISGEYVIHRKENLNTGVRMTAIPAELTRVNLRKLEKRSRMRQKKAKLLRLN